MCVDECFDRRGCTRSIECGTTELAQMATYEYEEKAPLPKIPLRTPKDSEIDEAIALVNQAKRPYIYIGGGAAGLGLGKEILDLAERIDAYCRSADMTVQCTEIPEKTAENMISELDAFDYSCAFCVK